MAIETVAVIGAGNGGKATAVDLALQGKRVHLFEFPEYAANLQPLLETRRLAATGAVVGEAVLGKVTTDLEEAVTGTDTIIVCTQALTHDRTARELACLVTLQHLVVLNPGSTGGTLHFARVFRETGMAGQPVMAEFSTLTYGCRASEATVDIEVKVGRVLYGILPAKATEAAGRELEALFPGLVRGQHVLHAGLNNANPVIHPAIALLNGARFELDKTTGSAACAGAIHAVKGSDYDV